MIFMAPKIKIMDDYNLTARERRMIMDEVGWVSLLHHEGITQPLFVYIQVRGRTGNQRALRPPVGDPPQPEKKKQISYLDLLRCGGKTHRLAAKKKKEKPKKKYRSYIYISIRGISVVLIAF